MNWKNLSITTASKNARRVFFILSLAALFVVYFYLQALIMTLLASVSKEWILGMYDILKTSACDNLSFETINVE